MNENTPILVAPRPVRIASESGASSYAMRSGTPFRLVSAVADHFERAKIGGDIDIDEQKATAFVESASSDKDLASTRSSPRSSLPSEALEEFFYQFSIPRSFLLLRLSFGLVEMVLRSPIIHTITELESFIRGIPSALWRK